MILADLIFFSRVSFVLQMAIMAHANKGSLLKSSGAGGYSGRKNRQKICEKMGGWVWGVALG